MITYDEIRRVLALYNASKPWCSYFSADPQLVESLKGFASSLKKDTSAYSNEVLRKEELFNLFCILSVNRKAYEDYNVEDYFEEVMPPDSFEEFIKLKDIVYTLSDEKHMTFSKFSDALMRGDFIFTEDDRKVYHHEY